MTKPNIDIEGALVAERLGLELSEFRQLMADGKITVLCERGTDADAGHYRASFYYGNQRARFIVDDTGHVVGS